MSAPTMAIQEAAREQPIQATRARAESVSTLRRVIARTIPTSSGLSDESWRARHRAILVVAWIHVVGIPIFALARKRTLLQAIIETLPILLFTLVGTVKFDRRLRAVSVTLALMLSSAVIVHLSAGVIEMHFHFFVMIPIVALYHDWLPFGVAVCFVWLHHGVIGTLEPSLVYVHEAAQRSPWRWAGLHAGFIAALSVVCIAGWRINQLVLERQQKAESDLLDEKRVVETLHGIGTGIVSELDVERVSQLVTDSALLVTRAAFAAFFYNVEDATGDSYMLYTLSGVDRSAFSSFPMPRNTKVFSPTFNGTGVVRSDDITKDPRYGQNAPYNGMPPGHLPVRSYLAVPVRSRGSSEVLGGLFFGHPEVGVFDERDEQIVVGIATQAAIAFDNARLYQAEREAYEAAETARARLSMLADAGRVLVSTLDPVAMVDALAKISVPTFADITVVDLLENGELRRVDAVGAPGLESFAESLKPYTPDPSNLDHPVVRVLNGEAPILTSLVTPDLLAKHTRGPEHADMVRKMEGTSSIVVPLVGRGSVLGVVSFLTVAASGRVLRQDDVVLAETLGRRAGMALENAHLYQAEREARAEADRATASLSLLAEAGRLSATPLNEEVRIQQLAQVTVPTLADACLIDVLEEDGTIRRVTAAAPGFQTFAEQVANFPPDPNDTTHPVIQIMRGEPSVLVEHIDDAFLRKVTRDAAHRKAAEPAAVGSTVIVPLASRGGVYGALSFINFTSSGRRFGPTDVPLAEEIGRRAGVAVHNARLYRTERDALAAAEDASARISLLADASRVLASSLDVEVTLQNVAGLTVPTLADLCVIDLLDDEKQLRRVAVSGAEGLEDFAEELRSAGANPAVEGHPAYRVIRGQGAQFIDRADRELLKRISPDADPAWIDRVDRAQVLSGIVVPLQTGQDVLGVLTLVTTALSGRSLQRSDASLAEDLGRRAGIAIENARLYAQQRGVAESLQHALLPQELPAIPGFEVTARYQPGGPGERVGGDWYDMFEIPRGEIAIVMGDVVGHGIPAASLMAQLRNALRAYVWDGLRPAEVLTRLNQFLYGVEPEGMATVSVGILDPITSKLSIANAGHPPFLRLSDDGEATFVGEGLGPPLGAVPFASFRETMVKLDPRDTLVFYTDGLVEDRISSLDAGLERMRAAAADPQTGIEEICERILEACLGGRAAEDDVAILVLRAKEMGTQLRMRLPAQPRVLSSLRQVIRRWLREQGVPDADAQEILVACGEACNNAIEHGAAPLNGWFEIEATMDGDLDVVVRSTGEWRARRDDGGGRGLPVMEALMDDVHVDRSGEGIEVHMKRKIRIQAGA